MNLTEIRRFRRNLRRFERLNQAQLKNCCAHVTLAQCIVLLEIDEGGQLTMSRLASRLRLDNSTLTRTIEGLVQRGLVRRLREDQDRRVIRIRLTSKGDGVCRAIHKQNDAHYGEVFARIPKSRRGTVIKNFEILVQAFLDHEVEAMATATEKEVPS